MSHRENRQHAHSAKTERTVENIAGFLLQSQMIADIRQADPFEVAVGALCAVALFALLPYLYLLAVA